MSYISPYSQKTIILTAGDYIAISSMGAGQTEVYYRNVGVVDYNPVLLANISEDLKTFGGYSRDKEVTIISYGAEIEYATGSMPLLRGNFTKSFGSYSPLTMVVAASTFVTLTNSDDEDGNTVLTSEGAHGLTEANAVGNKIYITWSDGDATSGFYEILAIDVDTEGVAITIDLAYSETLGEAVVAIEDDTIVMNDYMLDANTLKQGSVIIVEALFSCSASAGKNITITYGGVAILDFDIASSSKSLLTNKRVCQCSLSEILTNAANQPGFGASTSEVVRDSVDATADNEFIISATLPTADEPFTLESYRTEIHY